VSVAYQGAPGAFGHEACLAFLPHHDAVPKPTFASVVDAVENGEALLGILPVANNCAGPVAEAQALIAGSGLTTIAEHELAVRMHLLALPGVRLKDIRRIASHPVALKQCSRALAGLRARLEEAPNTAIAARDLADPDLAVLASEAAARAYGLAIIRRDMQDRPDNATRFAVLARPDR
jgi:prephenate dehydratase